MTFATVSANVTGVRLAVGGLALDVAHAQYG
jgi:hypothetical protein